jgi:hypothetical protein
MKKQSGYKSLEVNAFVENSEINLESSIPKYNDKPGGFRERTGYQYQWRLNRTTGIGEASE